MSNPTDDRNGQHSCQSAASGGPGRASRPGPASRSSRRWLGSRLDATDCEQHSSRSAAAYRRGPGLTVPTARVCQRREPTQLFPRPVAGRQRGTRHQALSLLRLSTHPYRLARGDSGRTRPRYRPCHRIVCAASHLRARGRSHSELNLDAMTGLFPERSDCVFVLKSQNLRCRTTRSWEVSRL